jgi:hypothetical protein
MPVKSLFSAPQYGGSLGVHHFGALVCCEAQQKEEFRSKEN